MKFFPERRKDQAPAQPESPLIRQRFTLSAEELETGHLFCDTTKTALDRVRSAVDSIIVVDESTDDRLFCRRYETATMMVNETEVTYTQLVWSTFNDPYKEVTLKTGDTTLRLGQGVDINLNLLYTNASLKRHTAEGEPEEVLWQVAFEGPYPGIAHLAMLRQPGEFGGEDSTATALLESTALAIDEYVSQMSLE